MTALVICLGISVLTNVYLLWGIKIYYETGYEKGRKDGYDRCLEVIREKLKEKEV